MDFSSKSLLAFIRPALLSIALLALFPALPQAAADKNHQDLDGKARRIATAIQRQAFATAPWGRGHQIQGIFQNAHRPTRVGTDRQALGLER